MVLGGLGWYVVVWRRAWWKSEEFLNLLDQELVFK